MLNPPIVLKGTVIHGKGLGHTVGMPTANLALYPGQEQPPEGVYAVRVTLPDGSHRTGVTNIGHRPSVDDEDSISIETLILDFDGDLYQQPISLELCFFLRAVRRFSGLEAVRDQVRLDCEKARGLIPALP